MMDFDQAFERLRGHEGGFTQDRTDSGNWTGGEVGLGTCKGTKYGISAAAYPGEDIEHLTIERARELYRRDYWGPAGCDCVPDAMRFDLFDMAVNSGVKAAVRALQKAAGQTEDGVLGPRTLQAVQSMPALRLVARFNGARLLHVTEARAWPSYGRGWARRIALNLLEA
jgi:lysozyme family protein